MLWEKYNLSSDNKKKIGLGSLIYPIVSVCNLKMNAIVYFYYANSLARILDSGINLVHPYSRNKSDK